MKRPALVATFAIILTACESAAPVAPSSFNRDALFDAGGAAGVCNAVFAQLEHRGTVEEHVLAAAARQNAELIQQLQVERSALEAELANAAHTVAILDAEAAAVDARTAEAQAVIAELEALLAEETDPKLRAALEAKLQDYQAELATLQAKAAAIRSKRDETLAQLSVIQSRIAEIDAQLARGGC